MACKGNLSQAGSYSKLSWVCPKCVSAVLKARESELQGIKYSEFKGHTYLQGTSSEHPMLDKTTSGENEVHYLSNIKPVLHLTLIRKHKPFSESLPLFSLLPPKWHYRLLHFFQSYSDIWKVPFASIKKNTEKEKIHNSHLLFYM